MRITWVGVPSEARKELRKRIKDNETTGEYMVCSNKGANQKVKAYIRDSLWAFKTDFIAYHTKVELSDTARKSLNKMKNELSEDANEIIFALLKSFKTFWQAAIHADGRGHFLNHYDGIEQMFKVNGISYFIYRTN